MSLTRIHIAAFLLVLAVCNTETTGSSKIKVNDSDTIERNVANYADDAPKVDEQEAQDSVEEMLPILPPIILLDFDNGTNDDNATGDEKSKRTVNNGLGYGFDRNSVQSPRKYNYYFPAGKTGTTVSIEESISPFLPRTIIEKVSPSNQKPVSSSFANVRQQEYRLDSSAGSNFRSPVNYQFYHSANQPKSPVFGLRTKLTKTSEPYQGFVPIVGPSVDIYSNGDYRKDAYASTTSQPLAFSHTESTGYEPTPSPQSYTTSTSNRYAYVTSSPLSYTGEEHSQRYLGQSSQHALNVQGYSRPAENVVESSSTPNSLETAAFLKGIGVSSRVNLRDYVRSGSNVVESSTSEADNTSGYAEHSGQQFANLPRYTTENGVRYENKIFWKYPDGRVSHVPPMAYETYSYPQAAKAQETAQIYESASTEDSVQSQQGPVQFPMSPEPSAPSQPTSFISAETLSSLPQQQVYRLRYQNLVNQKQTVSQQAKAGSGISSSYSVSSTTPSLTRNSFKLNGKSQKTRYEIVSRRPISKYMVNSPNPEYVAPYTTESTLRGATSANPFLVSGGKYSAKKTNVDSKNLENYSNLQYADLLNYNPSISQYIKNPASILNVQPTFVQAGSSLIPVIILRVDGVPPIQPKATPNVNLKALLQQYLVQYARSIEELARPSTYDLGNDDVPKDQHSFSTSLRELARLAQNNENDQDLLGNPTESYIGKTSYETSSLEAEKSLLSGKYGERMVTRPKVKSVQILEDPRFPNYRVKN